MVVIIFICVIHVLHQFDQQQSSEFPFILLFFNLEVGVCCAFQNLSTHALMAYYGDGDGCDASRVHSLCACI